MVGLLQQQSQVVMAGSEAPLVIRLLRKIGGQPLRDFKGLSIWLEGFFGMTRRDLGYAERRVRARELSPLFRFAAELGGKLFAQLSFFLEGFGGFGRLPTVLQGPAQGKL